MWVAIQFGPSLGLLVSVGLIQLQHFYKIRVGGSPLPVVTTHCRDWPQPQGLGGCGMGSGPCSWAESAGLLAFHTV